MILKEDEAKSFHGKKQVTKPMVIGAVFALIAMIIIMIAISLDSI